MKKIILGLSSLFLGTITYGQGLDSIIVEKYYVSNAADAAGSTTASAGSLPAGSVTYRVFADLKAGYEFQATYGEVVPGTSTTHTLLINTTTKFFNNEDRGMPDANSIASVQLKNNTVALDSWFSVGATAAGQLGVLKSEDNTSTNLISANTLLKNTAPAMGIPLTSKDGMLASPQVVGSLTVTPQAVTFVGLPTETAVFDKVSQLGSSFSTSNGSIASLSGSVGPTSFNRVLIGQFTTTGVFHFELNIQIGANNGAIVEKWVSSNPVGAEFTAPSLTYTSPVVSANVLPTVSITAPTTAASFANGEVVEIAATATDTDGSIDSVEFFVDALKIGSDVSSPYTYTFVCTPGTHTLTATATDNVGGNKTATAVTIDVTTAINELNANSLSLMIYPNPAKDLVILEINASKQSIASYTIYDAKGNQIATKKLGTVMGQYLENIDISSYSQGQYLIYLSLDGAVTTKKLIKN